MLSCVADSATARMVTNILAMCISGWFEEDIQPPTKNWNEQNQTQKQPLDNSWPPLPGPKSVNDNHAYDLVENQQE